MQTFLGNIKYCECGCGGLASIATKTDNKHGRIKGQPLRFIRNHHCRGRRHTAETKRKLSELNKGKRKGVKHTLETRKKMSEAAKGKIKPPMTQEQRDKISKTLTGVKHPAWRNRNKSIRQRGNKSRFWKGGKTPDNLTIRTSKKYQDWRKVIFERDNYTCQKCGDNRGRNLNAHHINSFSKILEQMRSNFSLFPVKTLFLDYDPLWKLDNGVTICKNCHKENQYKHMESAAFLNYLDM